MSWLRALAFNIAFFGVTAVLGVAALPLLLAPRRTAMRFGRFWAQCVLALLKAIVGLDGEIRGIEHLPPGACLIAMKHQSAWDALILPVVLGDPAVVIKRELLWLPFYGWYAARAGAITIEYVTTPGHAFPSVACMVTVDKPNVVGVPESRPPGVRVRPAGRVPLTTEKV